MNVDGGKDILRRIDHMLCRINLHCGKNTSLRHAQVIVFKRPFPSGMMLAIKACHYTTFLGKTMTVASLLRSFIVATAFASASFAQAGAIDEATSWSANGSGDVMTITNSDTNLNMFYSRGTYFCAGCGDNYFNFTTTIDTTGTGGFDFDYRAFNGWYMAGSDLTILINNVAVASYGGDNIQNTFSYAFTAGDTLTLRAHETNGDSQPYIDGRIALNNFTGIFAPSEVPEPASFALMGLGLLGAAAARRKSARRK